MKRQREMMVECSDVADSDNYRRVAVAMVTHLIERRCSGCGQWFELTGRSDRKTCSNKCRNRAARARMKAKP